MLWFAALGGACQSTAPSSVERKPQVAPAPVSIDAPVPTAVIDAAVAVPPPPSKAESWVLVRHEDKLTAVACTSSSGGKVTIHRARECAPLEETSLAAVDSKGKSVNLTASREPVACRTETSMQSKDVAAFEVAGGKPPAIAFYPAERAPKQPLVRLDKRWTPTPQERAQIFETQPGDKLDSFAIANLDNDPELERLVMVSQTDYIAVGHGQTAGQLKSVTQSLVIDEGDKTFQVLVTGRPRNVGLDFKVSIAAVTDLDGDGFRELWLELDDGSRLWQVYEVSDEDAVSFDEDCRIGD